MYQPQTWFASPAPHQGLWHAVRSEVSLFKAENELRQACNPYLARPKSPSLKRRRCMRMFAGLMSLSVRPFEADVRDREHMCIRDCRCAMKANPWTMAPHMPQLTDSTLRSVCPRCTKHEPMYYDAPCEQMQIFQSTRDIIEQCEQQVLWQLSIALLKKEGR